MTYTQTELMMPPELGNLNHLGKLAEQLALRSEVKAFVLAGGEITIEKSEHRFATVEELMNDGYRLSAPKDLYRQKHS